MNPSCARRHFVMAIAKHLPPSAARLQLVDIGRDSARILGEQRADLEIHPLPAKGLHLAKLPADSVDAVVACDIELTAALFKSIREMLRPGGRFIAVLPTAQVSKSYVTCLEEHGYARILVEAAVDGLGVLIRGEKAHHHQHTWRRIQAVARVDDDLLDLRLFKGRYVHLLIRQRPNKPVWKLGAGEKIRWHALAIQRGDDKILLAFSSLPKAVGFMQPAVAAGDIYDINKVGKFDKAQALDWRWSAILNPKADAIHQQRLAFVEIDPTAAAAPDE